MGPYNEQEFAIPSVSDGPTQSINGSSGSLYGPIT